MALIQRKRRRENGFDLTPLIDVVFQLLIFLMVISQFKKPESLVDLPGVAAKVTAEDEREKIAVGILPDGTVEIDGKPIVRAAFEETMVELVAGGLERVEFRGDEDASFGLFVELMEEARRAGVKSQGIVREIEEGSE